MRPIGTNRKSRIENRECRSRPAFTLMELLMVIAVIGVLAGLLLSAVSRAKSAARGVECLSNNKQLVLAWNLYAEDHNGRLVRNMDGMGTIPVLTNWVAGTMAIAGDARDAKLLVNRQYSLLAPYVEEAGLFKCPGDRSRLVRSYSMNARLNPGHPLIDPS